MIPELRGLGVGVTPELRGLGVGVTPELEQWSWSDSGAGAMELE